MIGAVVIIGLYVVAAVAFGVILGGGFTSTALALRPHKTLRGLLRADASFVDQLLHDAKFLTALFDALTTILLFVVATYFPEYDAAVKVVWGALQPVFILIIAQVSNLEAQIKTLTNLVEEAKNK